MAERAQAAPIHWLVSLTMGTGHRQRSGQWPFSFFPPSFLQVRFRLPLRARGWLPATWERWPLGAASCNSSSSRSSTPGPVKRWGTTTED
ncbi:hypothetical protein PVAP13_9KG102200 [Panicum virgatum]|uniref:Uncharacterized protein n=1 Tax=Panicum virgatum TaxID=38727 RepID=A0A8T0NK05_PANVG|nr:hypothetical protein PVAP13_9KG102200 [Panicum virgatum]